MSVNGDVLGFSREARGSRTKLDRYQRGPCLTLMIHLYDEAKAEGRHYDEADHRLHTDVMAGRMPCPLQDTCEAYKRAVERGGKPLRSIPRQLSFDWRYHG